MIKTGIHVSDSLAGRCVMLQLENLSSGELRRVKLTEGNKEAYINLMTRGQFPELWRLPDLPSKDFYSSYLATYLERKAGHCYIAAPSSAGFSLSVDVSIVPVFRLESILAPEN